MEKDIAILAKQRCSRPVYTRVISWEFSQAESDNTQPVSRRRHRSKRKEKQTEATDEGEQCDENLQCCSSSDSPGSAESGSDSDEYLSAVEVIEDSEDEDDEGKTVNLSKQDSESNSEENIFDGAQDATETSSQSAAAAASPRRRRHSSRRKRKWRRKVNRFEYMAPYAHVENLDFDLDLQSIQDSVTSINIADSLVVRPVPTLVELCLRANSRVVPATKTTPPLLEKLMHHQYENNSLRSIQLHWLHNMLGYYEQKTTTEAYQWLGATWNRETQETKYDHSRLRRNIWKEAEFGAARIGEEGTDILPYTHYNVEIFKPNLVNALSVMVSTINLMLPTNIAHNYGCNVTALRNQSDSEIVKTAIEDKLVRLKDLLTTRFPGCMKHFYDHAVPYVWWMRGNVEQAAEAFLKLIEKLEKSEDKAVYLNEMARLFVQFGHPQKAISLFPQAAEQMSTKPASREARSYQLPLQTRMLCAAALDSGVFIKGRSSSARRLWKEALSLTSDDSTFAESVVYGASSSLMCAHAVRHSDTSSCWEEEVTTHLLQLASSHPQFYLYLSFVQALQGQGKKSLQSYQQYIQRFAFLNTMLFRNEMPGHSLCSRSNRYGFNVWDPLLAMRKREGGSKVLRLNWRTQLCHPVFLDEGVPFVADFQPSKMSLWMTSDGDLTGDMSMALPPIEQVRLNPYTGQLVFTSQGQGTTFRKMADQLMDEHVPPRVVQVYSSDADGVTVSLLQSLTDNIQEYWQKSWSRIASYQFFKGRVSSSPCHCCVLHYRGPGGQRAKLDLKKLLKMEMKKRVEAEIRDCKEHSNSAPWKKDMMDSLEQHHRCGWSYSFKSLSDLIKTKQEPDKTEEHRRKERKYKPSGKKPQTFRKRVVKPGVPASSLVKKRQARSSPPPTLVSLRVENVRVVGKCLILFVYCQDMKLYATVVIDCSSVETFRKPTIAFNTSCVKPSLVTPASSQDGSTCGVFMVADSSTRSNMKNRLMTFTTRGEIVQDRLYEETPRDDPVTFLTCVIDDLMYGIHPEKERLVCDKLIHYLTSEKFAKALSGLTVLGKTLLLCADQGLGVRDKDMDPVTWRPCCKLSLSLSEDRQWLFSPLSHQMSLLAQKRHASSRCGLTGEVVRCLIGFSNHLLVVEEAVDADQVTEVCVLLDLDLPGWPTEACFITEQDGFVVTATIFDRKDSFVQENLYQFTYDGCLQGVLPFLGRAPHSFYPVYMGDLPVSLQPVSSPGEWRSGWHLYFRDGYGAIACTRVSID